LAVVHPWKLVGGVSTISVLLVLSAVYFLTLMSQGISVLQGKKNITVYFSLFVVSQVIALLNPQSISQYVVENIFKQGAYFLMFLAGTTYLSRNYHAFRAIRFSVIVFFLILVVVVFMVVNGVGLEPVYEYLRTGNFPRVQ
jgi:hypothetical protein